MTASRQEWVPTSESELLEVKEELERIVTSAPFRNSRRYPALLQYVVEKALSGDVGEIKERTLGIEVFHRPADYDTNADPVVRFSAGEVRRRIAQFYQEDSHKSSLEISLPTGSYVPQFFRIEAEPAVHSEDALAPHEFAASDDDLLPVGRIPSRPLSSVSANQPRSYKGFLFGLILGVLAVSVVFSAAFLVRSSSRNHEGTPISKIWKPVLEHPDAVMISTGRTLVNEEEIEKGLFEPLNATIEQHILRPEARISLSAVRAVSRVAGFLQTHHKQFRIKEAYSTTLQDLHQRPVVLVGGYNNIWTMRLLKPLRFHLGWTGDLHYIVDAQHPDLRDWDVDFNMPYLRQTVDYAIIARFYDPTTGGPVIVIAGIGSNGSEAAGEFMVSPNDLQALAHLAPHGQLDGNFEAVLRVQVVAGDTGDATVIATQFW